MSDSKTKIVRTTTWSAGPGACLRTALYGKRHHMGAAGGSGQRIGAEAAHGLVVTPLGSARLI